jgi:diketogulonate reductase-like aldo/keto reductase
MLYKTIGDKQVSVIGQGNIKDLNAIKRNLSLGINLIDTSESYGTEEIIKEAIKGQREKVFISDKFSPEHNGYDDVIKSCESSLKKLGTDYIDLYSMHYPNPNFDIENTLSVLASLQIQGKVKNIGLCNVTHKQVEGFDLDFIQNEYNLFDRSAESIFGHCKKHNINFIGYSPFYRFYSLPKERMLWLQEIAFKYNKTLSQIVLKWLVSHDIFVLTKTEDIKHQKLNADIDFDLSKELDGISKLFEFEVSYLPPKDIKIIKTGKYPRTLEEAKTFPKWVVKPQDVSIEQFKPIKVELKDEGYELIDGGLRYWAWMIKNPETPIPCIIIDNTPID